MTELKREYVIPLRRKTRTAPKWRRSKKAVSVLKDFIRKHMKADDVILCKELNEHIWRNGAKNPPGKVSVSVLRTEISGEHRVLVNLSSVGVEKQRELYAQPVEKAAPVKDAKADESKVQEAQVTEKEVKEEVTKEEEPKTVEEKAEKKTEEKKEVKKNG